MKKLLLIIVVIVMNQMVAFSQGATDLFFSEYVEGSSYNKYLEVFNGTGVPVDLSNYKLVLYSNGEVEPFRESNLTGSLANGEVVVYKYSSSVIYGGAAYNATACNFNGNDAIVLFKFSTNSIVDIIGCIGQDPGSAWVDGIHSTLDKTLVRKPTVISGVTQNPAMGFSTLVSQWDVKDLDEISNLGSHTFTPTVANVIGIDKLISRVKIIVNSNMSLSISAAKDISQVKLINTSGMQLATAAESGGDGKEILIPAITKSGMYIVVVIFEDGTVEVQKVLLK